jgi:PIN domain nuclease of toxin-antitoxin system
VKLLLDSCTLIWLASDPARLSPTAVTAINDSDAELCVSHASLWELALKHEAGKLTLPDPPRRWWSEQVRQWNLQELPLTAEVLLRGSELPRHHKDPFDRILLAQSIAEGLTLVSPDGNFPLYPVKLIW